MKYVHVHCSPFHRIYRSFMSGMMYPNNLIPLRGIRYFLLLCYYILYLRRDGDIPCSQRGRVSDYQVM